LLLWLSQNRLLLFCILFSILLLVVGLWPFNFRTDNRAYLISGGGLKFDGPAEPSKRNLGGMAFTPNPLSCRPKDRCEKGALSIEIVLRAENEATRCLRRILELRRSNRTEAFILGQWKSEVIVRSFNTTPARGKRYHEIGVRGVLEAGRTHLLTIVSGARGADIYTDGQLVKHEPGVGLLKEDETLEGHTVYLGNAPDLSCPWAGSVLGLLIFGTAMSSAEVAERQTLRSGERLQCSSHRHAPIACFRFDDLARETITDFSSSDNNLSITGRLVFEKPMLELPDSQSFSASDLALNLLGFVPLGFLLCLFLLTTKRLPSWGCLLSTVIVGLLVSLAIEVTQVWLPGRDSSMLDLVANTLGTGMGGIVVGLAKGSRIQGGADEM
jgi:VanZ family protein